MNPNSPDVRGRAEIEAHFRRAFDLIACREMTLTPVEVAGQGQEAWELSTFTQVIARPGQPPAEDRGRVLLVWRRDEDSSWRIRYALVNSSLVQSPLH
jgi:ketosteroid isomerase-like protein